jgi:hypothetical protein
MERTSRTTRLVLASCLVAVLALGAATPAFALTNPKVTLDQQTGGQPTRFTVVTITDKDAAISSMDIIFPAGFDLSAINFDVVTLEGLRRVTNKPKGTPKGETLSIKFDPVIAPGSSLRIQVRNVDTLIKGARDDPAH